MLQVILTVSGSRATCQRLWEKSVVMSSPKVPMLWSVL